MKYEVELNLSPERQRLIDMNVYEDARKNYNVVIDKHGDKMVLKSDDYKMWREAYDYIMKKSGAIPEVQTFEPDKPPASRQIPVKQVESGRSITTIDKDTVLAAARAGSMIYVLDECDRALRQNPVFGRDIKEIADRLRAEKNPHASEMLYGKVLDYNPKDGEAYLGLVFSLAGQGKWAEAEGRVRYLAERNKDDDRLRYYLGRTLKEQGKLEEAADVLKKCIDGGRLPLPNLERARREYISVANTLAMDLVKKGGEEDKKSAFSYMLNAISVEPDNPVHHVRMGVILRMMGRKNDAENAFRYALEKDPGNASAHYGLGTLLSELGRRNDAIIELRTALAVETDPKKQENIREMLAKI